MERFTTFQIRKIRLVILDDSQFTDLQTLFWRLEAALEGNF